MIASHGVFLRCHSRARVAGCSESRRSIRSKTSREESRVQIPVQLCTSLIPRSCGSGIPSRARQNRRAGMTT